MTSPGSSSRANSAGAALAPVTAPQLSTMKRRGEKIVALTAYDYPTAALVDRSGVDVILVGDSAASVVLGYDTTLPVTLDEMLVLFRAARRGVERALLVADLPFGHGHDDAAGTALESAVRFVKAGAQAVKLEGGGPRVPLVRSMVEAGIPVMGHLGLLPQSVHAMGGYRVQGKTTRAADALLQDARRLEEAGVFALVLEGLPAEVAGEITSSLDIPTIGIGAGAVCDGQILVLHDMLGLTVPPGGAGKNGRKPRFVREYAHLRNDIAAAITRYAEDVRNGDFPSPSESYRLSEGVSARATT